MTKYNLGDRVKRVNTDYGFISIGDRGTVTYVNQAGLVMEITLDKGGIQNGPAMHNWKLLDKRNLKVI